MQHFYRDIKGWATFAPLYAEMVEGAPEPPAESHFVEVGSWLGRSAAFMAVEIVNSRKTIRFDCVDPWSDGGPDLAHKAAVLKTPLYELFLRNIEPVKGIVNPVRLRSVEAAARYADASLDFVMVDGSHVYEDVRDDIAAWLPKLKPGATIGFDDMNWPGVQKAVREAFDAERIKMHYGSPRQPPRGRCSWASCLC